MTTSLHSFRDLLECPFQSAFLFLLYRCCQELADGQLLTSPSYSFLFPIWLASHISLTDEHRIFQLRLGPFVLYWERKARVAARALLHLCFFYSIPRKNYCGWRYAVTPAAIIIFFVLLSWSAIASSRRNWLSPSRLNKLIAWINLQQVRFYHFLFSGNFRGML